MMLLSSLSTVVALAASVVSAAHDSTHQMEARHKVHVNRAVAHHNGTVEKRFSGGQATFYDVGLGACGEWSKPNDMIVALNIVQWGNPNKYPGENCFKTITIRALGKTVGGVVIMDQCPTCGYGSLDMSRGLFNRFADEGRGVFPIEWWYGDSGGDDDKKEEPKTTSKPPPPRTTTTSTRRTTTTTTEPRTTTTSTSEAESTTSASVSESTTGTESSSAPASTTSGGAATNNNDTNTGGGAINQQQRLVANFGYMAATGRGQS